MVVGALRLATGRMVFAGGWFRGFRFPLAFIPIFLLILVHPAGAVISMTPATGMFTVGDVVTISGMNTENSTTFLFVSGPYLDDNGVLLTNTSQPATMGSLDKAPVFTNFSWYFEWNTSLPEVNLREGTFIVYAMPSPLLRKGLAGHSYAQQTFFFHGSTTPAGTPTTAAPTPVPTWTPPPAGTEVQVSSGPTDDTPGRSDGDFIAYEARHGQGDSDIYLYNITSGNTTAVAVSPAYEASPALSGTRLVYSAYETHGFNRTDTDLFVYDLATGETQRLTRPGDQLYPRISGDLLVWQDEPPGRSSVNVMLSDLGTGIQRRVPAATWAYRPDVSGGNVIWTDDPAGPAIFLYDISEKTVRRVTNRTGIQGTPVLDGNRITWADTREDYAQVYVFDLGTGNETQVTSGNTNHFTPSISGNRVVWVDFRNGNRDIYLYDLASRQESPVVTALGDQVSPQISGCTVSWADNRNGSYDVYYKKLAGCTPPPTPVPVSLEPEVTVTLTPVETQTQATVLPTTPGPVRTRIQPPTVPTTKPPGFDAIPACISGAVLVIVLGKRRRS